MRLLIISDDELFAKKLDLSLRQVHFNVDVAGTVEQGEFWARSTDYDLAVVEHSQQCNATNICREIRARGRNTIIMVVTELLSSDEAIELFNAGVDDYISKFSHFSEIIARIKALLRRPRQMISDEHTLGDLVLDARRYVVRRGKKQVHLTKKEFGILEYMLRNKDIVLTRTDLIEHVWDINTDLFSNSLETHILNLRKKIEKTGHPKLIHTVSGRGYKIALQP
ncbi:response regulator transcription factor [bacterium]|nr:MAG: response regulator transcription factor [bacterium]